MSDLRRSLRPTLFTLLSLLPLSLALLCACPSPANAYSIRSGLTEGCHERITREAFLVAVPIFGDLKQLPFPSNELWRDLTVNLLNTEKFQEEYPTLSEDAIRFVLASLIVGVRSPDTEGHAVTDLNSLRQIHADPAATGQYAHALRGPADDGVEGERRAVQGTRVAIFELIQEVNLGLAKPPPRQLVKAQLYLDFYAKVELEVWEPAYLLGRALHALQDSFAHTIRTTELDLTT